MGPMTMRRNLIVAPCWVALLASLALPGCCPDGWTCVDGLMCPADHDAACIDEAHRRDHAPMITYLGSPFGVVQAGRSVTRVFFLVNAGDARATVTSLPLSPPVSFEGGDYPGSGGTCGTSLDAGTYVDALPRGSYCRLVLTFAPTTAGQVPGWATFESSPTNDDRYEYQLNTMFLTGAASAAAPDITMSPSLVDLGRVEAGTDRTIVLVATNAGTTPTPGMWCGNTAPAAFCVSNEGATYREAVGDAFSASSSTCGDSVGPGERCTITVTFAPRLAGPFVGTVRLGDAVAEIVGEAW